MEEKYVSDVLQYKTHIEPYCLIKIFSGVGSGKNTFIENFIYGNEDRDIPKRSVLLITSRRAKVDETISNVDIESHQALKKWEISHKLLASSDKIEKYINNSNYKIIPSINGKFKYVVEQKSVICTNAFIEYYFKEIYKPSDTSTHLWQIFDMIVVDEAHSLVTDATYQSSPFYTYDLINHYLTLCNSENASINCKHLILMTGTPKPLNKIKFSKIDKHLIAEYNLLNICRNTIPQTIAFTDLKNVNYIISNVIKQNEKLIYFSNHIYTPTKIRKIFKVDGVNFAVSFSDKDRRKKLDKKDREKTEKTEEYLKSGYLPEDLQLFFTTSKNKEGINIKNKDIKYMIIESHNQNNIVQMAGRVREGIEYLFIVNDSIPHDNKEYENIAVFSETKIANFSEKYIGVANEFYFELCKKNKIKNLYNTVTSENAIHTLNAESKKIVNEYIDYIHSTFPYVKYSYIHNAFMFYKLKEIGKADADYYEEIFSDDPKVWKDIFPNTEIKSAKKNKEIANNTVKKFLGNSTEKILTKEEADLLRDKLKEVLGLNDKSSLSPMIKKYTDYTCESVDKKGKRRIFLNK